MQRAFLKVFGGDHKPNFKDISSSSNRGHRNEWFWEEDADDEYYEEEGDDDDDDDWYCETFYEDDANNQEQDEGPDKLESAHDQLDETYISYIESRKRIKELASSGIQRLLCFGRPWRPEYGGFMKVGNNNQEGIEQDKELLKGKGRWKDIIFPNRKPMQGVQKPFTPSTTTPSRTDF